MFFNGVRGRTDPEGIINVLYGLISLSISLSAYAHMMSEISSGKVHVICRLSKSRMNDNMLERRK
jgi:hypothetical protein